MITLQQLLLMMLLLLMMMLMLMLMLILLLVVVVLRWHMVVPISCWILNTRPTTITTASFSC